MVLGMRRLGIAVLLAGVLSLAGCVTTNVNYGTISTFAGSPGGGYSGDGGQATAAKMQSPAAVAVDAAGNVYISDAGANVVRRVTPAGVISTVAGTGVAGFTADGGQATAAQLNQPEGIAIDSANNLYIAESGNNLVRRVLSGSGVITTVVGNSAGAAAPVAGFYGDGGLATLAGVNHPFGVALDAAGNLYVSDTVNNRIRKVTAATGIISTIAGNGGSGLTGDGGAATSATMYNPEGLLVASDGSIYVAEEANSVIRRIQSNGTISTFAGSTKYGFQGDGQAATSAQLDGPTAVAMDAGEYCTLPTRPTLACDVWRRMARLRRRLATERWAFRAMEVRESTPR